MINLVLGWVWLSAGVVSGTAMGLFFHDEAWLGGYDAWPRRLVRLGHIAFFGTGLLNIAYALTVQGGGLDAAKIALTGKAMAVGAITMPLVCFLAAWRKPLRHLFFIPVVALGMAVLGMTAELLGMGLGRTLWGGS